MEWLPMKDSEMIRKQRGREMKENVGDNQVTLLVIVYTGCW